MARLKRLSRILKKPLSTTPDHAKAHHALGLCYAKMNYFEQSIPLFNKAIKLDPRFTDAYADLGKAYMKHKSAGTCT